MNKCSVESCNSYDVVCRGYCNRHYRQWNRHGVAGTTDRNKRVPGDKWLHRGYIRIKMDPSDPLFVMADKAGRTYEHRLVLARSLGRALYGDETVHHINGEKTDNRLENLQLRSGSHGPGVVRRCNDCGSHNIESIEM